MIQVKSEKEIATMKEGGAILAEIMDKLKKEALPGKSTMELNRLAESLFLKYGKPSFKGHDGFPSAVCLSLNEEAVHGVPSERILKEGDILSLDLGLFYKNFHTDMAITVPIGKVDSETAKLIKTTKKALKAGIKEAKEGNTFKDIGKAIEKYVESQNFVVIKNLCGHGIGKELHEEPQILNFSTKDAGPEIKKGMVFCIEPIIGNGSWEIEIAKNGFTYKTKDNSLSAHFEHTLAITAKGTEILTV